MTIPQTDPRSDDPGREPLWRLGLVVVLALAVRLLWFTGMSLGDDGIYAAQVIAHARLGSWPPDPTHWSTRLGVTMPTVLAVWALGLRPIAFVLWPLAAGLLKVLVCRRVARSFTDAPTADLAALFLAAFPLEVIYSTHLFPDVPVGLLSTLGLWYWIRALREDRARFYAWSGAFAAAGYLCRETVVMEGPIYLALWGFHGRIRRPRLAWSLLVPVATVLFELGLYGLTAGDPFFRWEAVRTIQSDANNIAAVNARTAGGDFWTDPLLMLIASHEYGFYMAAGLAAAAASWRARPPLRPLALWLAVGFVWLYYGTTGPASWQPLMRDPRYSAVLSVPCVILIAEALRRLGPWPRRAIAAVLVGSGIFAATLDEGDAVLAPHRAFAASPYAGGAALEPFDYLGARWVIGLDEPAQFACASDCGRSKVARSLEALRGARHLLVAQADYFVFSPEDRPDLRERLAADGWAKVAAIPGQPRSGRWAVGRLLALIPSQRARARRLLNPTGLVVLARRARGPSPPAGQDGHGPRLEPGDEMEGPAEDPVGGTGVDP